MTVQTNFNITQVSPLRLRLQFSYDYNAEKWMISENALIDLIFYNESGVERQRITTDITIPSALRAAMQSALDNKLTQYIGTGGAGEGLTIYVPLEGGE